MDLLYHVVLSFLILPREDTDMCGNRVIFFQISFIIKYNRLPTQTQHVGAILHKSIIPI